MNSISTNPVKGETNINDGTETYSSTAVLSATPQTERRPPSASNGEEANGHPKRRHRGLAAALLLGSAVVVGAVATTYYFRFMAPFESTEDAYVEGRITAISSQVGGRVARVLVEENQEVKQGQALFEIAADDYNVRLSEALANLAAATNRLEQAKAQLSMDQAGAEQARSGVAMATAEANRAAADLKRYRAVEARAVSKSQLDLAEAQANSAAAQLQVAQNRAAAAEAQVKLTQATISIAAAQMKQTEAALEQARLNLSYTTVTAPEDGRVTRRSIEQGAFLQPGQSVMAVVSDQLWVVANYKETQLTHMHPGQPVEIKIDAYPGRKLKGHIDSIQKGAGARFSMFPPENATGNFVKVVQRVPVKIVFDEPLDSRLALGPGMSVEPKVRVK
jgi:membrane fusion protein (multidrug efflux system)